MSYRIGSRKDRLPLKRYPRFFYKLVPFQTLPVSVIYILILVSENCCPSDLSNFPTKLLFVGNFLFEYMPYFACWKCTIIDHPYDIPSYSYQLVVGNMRHAPSYPLAPLLSYINQDASAHDGDWNYYKKRAYAQKSVISQLTFLLENYGYDLPSVSTTEDSGKVLQK